MASKEYIRHKQDMGDFDNEDFLQVKPDKTKDKQKSLISKPDIPKALKLIERERALIEIDDKKGYEIMKLKQVDKILENIELLLRGK